MVTVSASDRVADGGAKHTLECSDRAETPAQARRCRAEEIVPFGEEEVGGVSVKETEDMAREWFAEAATPESVLIGVCAVARVLASRVRACFCAVRREIAVGGRGSGVNGMRLPSSGSATGGVLTRRN